MHTFFAMVLGIEPWTLNELGLVQLHLNLVVAQAVPRPAIFSSWSSE